MPEARLMRTRKSLPDGYRFGDAAGLRFRSDAFEMLFAPDRVVVTYQIAPDCPFKIDTIYGTANVIEGEHHSDDWAV